MKRVVLFLAAALLLTGCAAREEGAESLQARYAAMEGCEADVRVTVERGEEQSVYALSVRRADGETRVAVREPEVLSGVSAVVRDDEALTLEYDGMVLDAGSLAPEVSAVNAVSILLRAAAEGAVVERGVESRGDGTEARFLCLETEHAGETLRVAACFNAEDAPIYAEIIKNDRVLVYLEFTAFRFCGTMTGS
ncbi:MAG: hypothetical protein E7425_06005 [Ruminococcaceae bacterium]|nr:hypothetical protein [Oscillospiraceae bacterium]